MWVVFEMEGKGLTDELVRVVGPFETREQAEAYCIQADLGGVMQLEPPHE